MKLKALLLSTGILTSTLLLCYCEGTRDSSVISASISNDLASAPFGSIDYAVAPVSNNTILSSVTPAQPIIRPSSPVQAVTLPIIAYHHINPTMDSDMNVTPEAFRSHMQFLKNNGYTPITLSQWYEAAAKKTALPKKPVIITFDDGWRDQLTYAIPILNEFNFPATFFIYTSVVGSPNQMTWKDIKQLHAQGHEIGCHSATHSNLIKPFKSENAQLFAKRLVRETKESKKIIEENTGCTIRHFCYPYGFYNSDVINHLKRAGYHTAVTVNPCPNDVTTSPYLLGRYIIAPWTTLADFSEKLTTRRLRPQKVWPHDAGMYAQTVPSVHFTAVQKKTSFPRMRMKWKWKWTDVSHSPATSTVRWNSPNGSLSSGAYPVQVHAWDTYSNHYTYAWLFQKVDQNSPSVSASTILAPGYPPPEAL